MLILIILLAVGVFTKQPHKYYLHVLIAVGVWFVLIFGAAWVTDALTDTGGGMFGMLAGTLAYAIPGAIIAFGFTRRPLYRLIPGKRSYEGDA